MIEKWIARLEAEDEAMKQAYDRVATSLPLFTNTVSIVTSKNTITRNFNGGGSFSTDDPERIVVTLDTYNNNSTLATIEIDSTHSYCPKVRRVPYAGGAKWIVTNNPNGAVGFWQSTSYTVKVHSVVDGVLSASEISA